MRVHHLNCATFCPWGGALFDGRTIGATGELVGHCLLIETDAHGLVLVDTGFGLKDVDHPHTTPARIPRLYRGLLNIKLSERQTAVRQIEALGFRREDVRHIVLTHLDFDHAGGIEDFPMAAVHLLEAEYIQATARKGAMSKRRGTARGSGTKSQIGARTVLRASVGSASKRCANWTGFRQRS